MADNNELIAALLAGVKQPDGSPVDPAHQQTFMQRHAPDTSWMSPMFKGLASEALAKAPLGFAAARLPVARPMGSPERFWNQAKVLDAGLQGEPASAITEWVGGPHDAIARGLVGGPMVPARLESMVDAATAPLGFAQPMRDALRKEFGDTITAYRGEREGGGQSTGRRNNLASYSMDRRVAERFAGATQKEIKLIPEADIAAAENTLARTGQAEVGGRTYRRNPEDPKYIDMFDREGNFVTDTLSVRADLESINAYRAEQNAELAQALKGVREVKLPVDDVVWATDRFNQQELIALSRYLQNSGKK